MLSVTRYGIEHEFTSCGLRGCKYVQWIGGVEESFGVTNETIEEKVVVDWDFEGKEAYEEFTRATGARPDEWEHWYYEHVYVEDPMGSLSQYV